jgi:MoxR-like ATPase
MALFENRRSIYAAVDIWKHSCLLGDGSVFDAGSIWTEAHAIEVLHHLVNRHDEGKRSDESKRGFEEKPRNQLASVSVGAKQLAAEMLWVMMLFPDNIGRERKTELVQTVWDWSGVPFQDPNDANKAFDRGIGSGGMGYNNFRPFEMFLLIRFTAAWKALGSTERARLITDSWAFADWFDRLPDATSRQLRHMLFHLLFPDDFERISSTSDKKRVDAAFAGLLQKEELDTRDRGPSALARDRRLRHLRSVLERDHPNEFIDFYSTPDVAVRWQGTGDEDKKTPTIQVRETTAQYVKASSTRVWAIGAGVGASEWPEFLENGQIAIGWSDLGDLRQYESRDAIAEAMKRVYNRESEPTNNSLACFEFCHTMAIDDEVFVKQGRNRVLGHGRVVGDYAFDTTRPDFPNVRRVEWLSRGNWTLPAVAQIPMKTLTDITVYHAVREFLREQSDTGTLPLDAAKPYGVEDIVQDAFLSREGVEQLLASLRRRKNLILQGPPGVGKSFLARRLGYALIGAEAPENVQMVQFHQSYAYEDFIQGWRPNGAGGFERRNGVFQEFCSRAAGRPGEPHVFVIDEINRGNLSKVFGELLMLIEADKRGPEFAIPLTYAESATDTFYVPDNVYVIGLMNTADRSLAMVDYALRRRFAFNTLQPAFESPVFRRVLQERGVDEATIDRIVDRVKTVNRHIVADSKNLGPGFVIGHSYFCPTAVVSNSAAWYDMVVRDEIVPLLEEYWFDDPDRVAKCLAVLGE